MRLKVAWATDPGLERKDNEDAVIVTKNKAGVEALMVVCDGMGGHAAGQTASSIASKTVVDQLLEDGEKGPDPDRLKKACKRANTAVFEAARDNPAWAGMGSTMTVAAVDSDQVALLNVGDSPAYLFRDGEWKLISQDHSWPAEQVRLGVIKPEEAANHPLKHRLTRAIGVWESIQSYSAKLDLADGDTIVICSDGVETAGVSVEEMAKLIFKGRELDGGPQRVIDRCKELGAPDNVTVAVLRVEPDARKTVALATLKR